MLPSGARSRIAAVETADGPFDAAVPGRSVTIRLADDIDVTRGDVIAAADDPPQVVRRARCHGLLVQRRAVGSRGRRYLVKQATRTERVVVRGVVGRLDLDSLEIVEIDHLSNNDVGLVRVATAGPLVVDAYEANRFTGSFVLIDEATNATLGAGMVRCSLLVPCEEAVHGVFERADAASGRSPSS